MKKIKFKKNKPRLFCIVLCILFTAVFSGCNALNQPADTVKEISTVQPVVFSTLSIDFGKVKQNDIAKKTIIVKNNSDKMVNLYGFESNACPNVISTPKIVRIKAHSGKNVFVAFNPNDTMKGKYDYSINIKTDCKATPEFVVKVKSEATDF